MNCCTGLVCALKKTGMKKVASVPRGLAQISDTERVVLSASVNHFSRLSGYFVYWYGSCTLTSQWMISLRRDIRRREKFRNQGAQGLNH